MNRCESFDRLDFHNNRPLNKEINPITRIEQLSIVNDRQGYLLSEGHAAYRKFMREAFLIGALQQARAQRSMNLQAGVYHLPRYFLGASL